MSLHLKALKERGIYKINSRNLTIGVWESVNKEFIGIREKFGSRYLDSEYLARECGGDEGFDTAFPQDFIELLPDEITLDTHFGIYCGKCNKIALGKGENGRFCLSGCEIKELYWKQNQPLFDYLNKLEQEYSSKGIL